MIPLYLSGAVRPELVGKRGFGFMRTPRMGNAAPPWVWAADTGCYSPRGVRAFDCDAYLAWLDRQDRESCLFATAPDRVGDPVETLRLSLPVLPKLRALGFSAALVAQDGLEHLRVPWGAFDVLFIGGTTAWKLGPGPVQLIRTARKLGVYVHMGRVNSFQRFAYARSLKCHSVDGTFVAFAPTVNIARVEGWIAECLVRGN